MTRFIDRLKYCDCAVGTCEDGPIGRCAFWQVPKFKTDQQRLEQMRKNVKKIGNQNKST